MKNLFKIGVLLIIAMVLFSCDDGGDSIELKLQLKIDKTYLVADGVDQATLTLVSEDGTDYTSEAKFIVGDQTLTGNTFSTLYAGNYNCVAQYQSTQTESKTIIVGEEPIFKKNTLIENYTAVWCGYCPRIHDAVRAAVLTDDRVIPIAVHGYDDPFEFASYGTLMTYFRVSGFPSAVIDRSYLWPYPETTSGLNQALDKNAALGLSIESTLNVNQLDVTTKVKFGKDLLGDFKLVICLVEDDLIHDQTNSLNDGRGDPIVDYEHDNVLRAYGTDLYGDAIPSGEVVKDNVFSKSVSFDVSTYDSSKCKMVAFVVQNDEIINVRSALINTTVGFQEL